MNALNNFAAHRHLSNPMACATNLTIAIGAACLIMLIPSRSIAQQATLTDDAQISTAAANQNFGANASVRVSGTNIRGFFKFKLTPNLPPGTTGSRVGKATVRLFVGTVNTPGTFDVFRVNGTWDEATITGGTAPPLSILESSISVDALQTNKWVTLEVTQLVKDWLDGVLPNEGIALIANGGVGNVLFNSKENQTTSHETQLEIVLNHAATADRATEADNATNAATANSLSPTAVVPGSQISGDIPGKASSITGTVAGSQVSGPVAEATHAASAGSASTATTADGVIDIEGNQVISVAGNLHNAFVGVGAGGSDTTGTGNSFFGQNAGGNTTTGGNNAFFGKNAGLFNTTGGANSFFGFRAGEANTTGFSVSFFGTEAGLANTTGFRNTFFGSAAGRSNVDGQDNTFFGSQAGQNNLGNQNSFFGSGAGLSTTIGSLNSFFGTQAGARNADGFGNSFFGNFAGAHNSSGSFNSFFGLAAGDANTTGRENTFVGNGAGITNISGNGNTFVGAGTGSSTTDSFNTFVGFLANGTHGITNASAIGSNALVTQSNSIVLGNNVNVGIGTTAPQTKLHVQGGNILIGSAGQGIILKSPNGTTCRLLTIDDNGAMVLMTVTCP
jgi:hypothetical protein